MGDTKAVGVPALRTIGDKVLPARVATSDTVSLLTDGETSCDMDLLNKGVTSCDMVSVNGITSRDKDLLLMDGVTSCSEVPLLMEPDPA